MVMPLNKVLSKIPKKYTLMSTYTKASNYHTLKCTCGNTWKAVLSEIFRGRGCPRCAGNIKLTSLDIDKRLLSRPIYRLSKTINTSSKATWGFTNCGNIWITTANSILNGRGCSNCADYGFKYGKLSTLYVIKIITSSDEYLKVGITNRPPKDRYLEILHGAKALSIIEIATIEDSGTNMHQLEKEVHKQIPHYTVNKFNGSTELFNIDKQYNILEILANGV